MAAHSGTAVAVGSAQPKLNPHWVCTVRRSPALLRGSCRYSNASSDQAKAVAAVDLLLHQLGPVNLRHQD